MFSNCQYNKRLFRIAKEMSVSDLVTKIIAFKPPKDSLYRLEPINTNHTQCFKNKTKHCCTIKKVKFIHETYDNIQYKWIEENCYTFKNSNNSSRNKDKNIVILHIKNKNKNPDGFTILFSHGNASTLGTIYTTLIDLSTQLKCDIIAYDYSGYGKSEGKPSEKEIYCDIEEVGFFVDNILNIKPKEIVLLGHSLGSAPSVHLAITKHFKDVRAVILLSPIASGVKLVSKDFNTKDLDKVDVFCNIRKISDVACPIFLIHGQKDEVIPIEQSIEMGKFMKNSYEWHPRHGDHNNILTKYRSKFFQKCKFFFEHLNYYSRKQIVSNSTFTYNYNSNEKFYSDFFTNNNGFNNECMPYTVEESFFGGQMKREPDIPNGIPFSATDRIYSCIDIVNNNISYENKNHSRNKSDVFYFDHASSLNSSFGKCNKSAEETVTFRDSKLSNQYNDHKQMEEQYNMLILKHNGI